MNKLLDNKTLATGVLTWLLFYVYHSMLEDLEVFVVASLWATIYVGSILGIYLIFVLISKLLNKDE